MTLKRPCSIRRKTLSTSERRSGRMADNRRVIITILTLLTRLKGTILIIDDAQALIYKMKQRTAITSKIISNLPKTTSEAVGHPYAPPSKACLSVRVSASQSKPLRSNQSKSSDHPSDSQIEKRTPSSCATPSNQKA